LGSSQKVDVRGDGRVVIYLRDGLKRPIWQARIRVPNSTGYKVVSTKTENQRDPNTINQPPKIKVGTVCYD